MTTIPGQPLTWVPKVRLPEDFDNKHFHPFTVILYAESEVHVRQVSAPNADEAVKITIDHMYPTGAYEPWELNVIAVFYGHMDMCSMEGDGSWTWF